MFDDVTFGAMLGAIDRINGLEDALWQWQQHADKLENQLAAAQEASDRHYDLYSREFDAHKETRAQVNQAAANAGRSHGLYVSEHTAHQKTKALLAQVQAELNSAEERNSAPVYKLIEYMLVVEKNKALTARVAELEACLERAEDSIDNMGSENAQLHAFLFH